MTNEQRQLVDNIRIAIAVLSKEEEIYRQTVELIDGFSDDFDWTGIYLLRDGILEVGPYIGPETPHTRIELNQGICGAAAVEKKTIKVDDVKSDSRFLACSLSTRSEIVVPLMDGQTVIGQIDIDSNRTSQFTSDDQVMLEEIATVVVDRLKQVGRQ